MRQLLDQKMLWEENDEAVDHVIPRRKVIKALELLGLDAGGIRHVEMDPKFIEVQYMVLDSDGKMQIDPDSPNEVWTETRIYGVS